MRDSIGGAIGGFAEERLYIREIPGWSAWIGRPTLQIREDVDVPKDPDKEDGYEVHRRGHGRMWRGDPCPRPARKAKRPQWALRSEAERTRSTARDVDAPVKATESPSCKTRSEMWRRVAIDRGYTHADRMVQWIWEAGTGAKKLTRLADDWVAGAGRLWLA